MVKGSVISISLTELLSWFEFDTHSQLYCLWSIIERTTQISVALVSEVHRDLLLRWVSILTTKAELLFAVYEGNRDCSWREPIVIRLVAADFGVVSRWRKKNVKPDDYLCKSIEILIYSHCWELNIMQALLWFMQRIECRFWCLWGFNENNYTQMRSLMVVW